MAPNLRCVRPRRIENHASPHVRTCWPETFVNDICKRTRRDWKLTRRADAPRSVTSTGGARRGIRMIPASGGSDALIGASDPRRRARRLPGARGVRSEIRSMGRSRCVPRSSSPETRSRGDDPSRPQEPPSPSVRSRPARSRVRADGGPRSNRVDTPPTRAAPKGLTRADSPSVIMHRSREHVPHLHDSRVTPRSTQAGLRAGSHPRDLRVNPWRAARAGRPRPRGLVSALGEGPRRPASSISVVTPWSPPEMRTRKARTAVSA